MPRLKSSGIEVLDDSGAGGAFYVHIENRLNDGSGLRVYLVMFFAVDTVAERVGASGAFTFERAFVHTSANFLGELGGIVFCEAFHKAL